MEIFFDQLTIVERIERRLDDGGEDAARLEIELLKKEINRKLYQTPPVNNE